MIQPKDGRLLILFTSREFVFLNIQQHVFELSNPHEVIMSRESASRHAQIETPIREKFYPDIVFSHEVVASDSTISSQGGEDLPQQPSGRARLAPFSRPSQSLAAASS